MVLTVAASVLLTVIYLVFSDQIIAMFGGTVNEETFRHSKEYFFWITLGIPFYMFGQAMNPVIRADGSPKFAMVSTLAGAVINIILDPIFIFCFKWGMMGAAVAALIIVEFFPGALIQIFGAANESVYYTEFAVKAFHIYLCMMIFACVNKAAFIFLQAMGKAAASTMLSMVREIVFGVGFALLLPLFFGLDGVLYSMPVSDILTALISAVVIAKTYKQLSE
ncbi:MAG: polysaccharide biosynthesis C-terminal domain-containing protein [Clostridia bacterium]|nr:polysaccharide biosynthesis C-terminal domain-containing protein [Clostridia bacterium]